jgi:hypothetical protein
MAALCVHFHGWYSTLFNVRPERRSSRLFATVNRELFEIDRPFPRFCNDAPLQGFAE